jgi:hypothetical protein
MAAGAVARVATRSGVEVRLRIEGHHLPGRRCGPYDDVHVALQVGRTPADPVPGDAATAVWDVVPGPVRVTARVDLTDDDGMPRCARLRTPAVEWSRS